MECDLIEKHVSECPRCFIALRLETPASDVKPSAAAKARLFEAVRREVRKPQVVWSWWERPLAVAFASAAIMAAGFAVHTLASSQGAAPHALTQPR